MESKIGIGGLINNKSVNDYSSLISLLADNNNSLHRPPLTFKTQINFVSSEGGIVSRANKFT